MDLIFGIDVVHVGFFKKLGLTKFRTLFQIIYFYSKLIKNNIALKLTNTFSLKLGGGLR